MRIVSILSQKGGVGKTTTALALAECLRAKKKKVLLVDADQQQNSSLSMGADLSGGGLYEAITGEPVSELIQHTNTGDILPATDSLIGSDGEFTGKLELLKDALAQVNYDHVIIDTPPALCAITLLAIVASSDLIIPLEPCLYSIQGFEQLYYYLNRIKDHAFRCRQSARRATRAWQ